MVRMKQMLCSFVFIFFSAVSHSSELSRSDNHVWDVDAQRAKQKTLRTCAHTSLAYTCHFNSHNFFHTMPILRVMQLWKSKKSVHVNFIGSEPILCRGKMCKSVMAKNHSVRRRGITALFLLSWQKYQAIEVPRFATIANVKKCCRGLQKRNSDT